MHSIEEISNEDIDRALRSYGFRSTVDFCARVRRYVDLLLRWNRRVSLTTITDTSEILRFHFGESLFAIQVAEIAGGRLADVGSGAGFPGLPLAMAIPELEGVLLESNGKKAAFLAEARRELRIENVTIHHGRTESLASSEKFDIIAGRAFGDYERLLSWSREHLDTAGRVVLWLGAAQAEEVQAISRWKWGERVQIPGTKGRFVLVGSPTSR